MKIINKLKTTKGMALGILVLFSLVLGLSYGTFIFSTGNYRSTSMLISNLLYGIDITTTGGNETINTKTVTLPSGKTSTILLKITSLNDVESKYGVSYKINSGTGSVKYSSNTGWLPTGKINKNGTGTYEKVIKIVIEATSDISVDFNVDGGYTYNDLKETKEGYTRVTEMYEGITDYTESLKTIIENETSNNIYGGEAINNYLQYPEDTDTTKNIWRIIGYYDSVDGIKIIANPVKETSTTNISTELTTFYNTLTKKSDYVLETNKFSCTGLNCTTSTYSNIGLLNTSEYSYIGGINSYLNENNYYVMDGTTIKNITSGNITEASTTSNLRPVIYLQSDVKVKGSGTITNPYKLSEKGDVVFASATLNGTSISFPKESDPYIPKTVTCTNGSVGEWNTEKQKIILTTVNLPTSCVVDFTEGYTVTLNVINGSTSPVSKVVGRDGVTSFTVTPNTKYDLKLESDTCNGTLSGNTYTISNITGNKTCNITLKKLPSVTLSVTNGSGSTTKTVNLDKSITFTVSPSTDYDYKLEVNTCNGTLSGNKYTINNVNEDKKCSISFKKKVYTIYNRLLADKSKRLTRSDFSTALTSTNTKTLYSASENNTTVYYFAGNATDNWVKFAGFYWRIIRTNSDKSIRLLFHGTSTTATDAYIAKTYFNSATKEDNYVGFMYGYVGTSGVNVADSQAKYSLDYFYSGEGAYNADSNKTFDTKPIDYADYISKSAIYCNDRSESSLTARDLRQLIGVPTDGDIYMATYRLIANKTPSYDCSQSDDKFTVNSYSGNGELDYPVGLMTADEIAFAGGVYVEELYDTTNILAYYYINSNGKNSSGDFWTMTPAFHRYEIGDSDAEANMFTVKSGKLGRSATNVYSSYVIRPVISIIGTTNWKSGDGSPSNPYELDI